MTKQELSRYFWLQHEIKRQKHRLETLERKLGQGIVGDTVNDYRTGRAIPVRIEGIPQEAFTTPIIIKLLKEEIQKNIEESEAEIVKIEKYIQEIENPQIREVMRCRFIDCMIWEDVGKQNFMAPGHARRLVSEYLRECA